jgi:hypothetical protein
MDCHSTAPPLDRVRPPIHMAGFQSCYLLVMMVNNYDNDDNTNK